MEFLSLLIIALVGWLLVGQPVVQLVLLLRKPRTRNVKIITLIGLLIHVLFLAVFGYSLTFEGAYNISGHGRYEETPPFLFESMFMFLIASVLMFSVLVIAINDSKQHR